MITFKKESEILKMREACKIVTEILMALKEIVKPGVSTMDLDQFSEEYIRGHGAIPSEKGYVVPGIPTPFPSSICASINDEVVHGIPASDRILREGDIVSVDLMACYQGYHGDAAYTFNVGQISPERSRLLDVTREALSRGIEAAGPGGTIGDIGYAVESYVKPLKFGIVRDYAGHGIGRNQHEPPQVPNYGKPGRGVTLKPGMTIAIEPMIMAGEEKVYTGSDGWVVLTADGSDAAHFEKTILVTEDGVEILTPWE